MGKYPNEVSVELERIYLVLGRRSGSWDRDDDETRIVSKPRSMSAELQSVSDPIGFAVASLADLETTLHLDHIPPEKLSAACELIFSAAEAGSLTEVSHAAALLIQFGERHALRC